MNDLVVALIGVVLAHVPIAIRESGQQAWRVGVRRRPLIQQGVANAAAAAGRDSRRVRTAMHLGDDAVEAGRVRRVRAIGPGHTRRSALGDLLWARVGNEVVIQLSLSKAVAVGEALGPSLREVVARARSRDDGGPGLDQVSARVVGVLHFAASEVPDSDEPLDQDPGEECAGQVFVEELDLSPEGVDHARNVAELVVSERESVAPPVLLALQEAVRGKAVLETVWIEELERPVWELAEGAVHALRRTIGAIGVADEVPQEGLGRLNGHECPAGSHLQSHEVVVRPAVSEHPVVDELASVAAGEAEP